MDFTLSKQQKHYVLNVLDQSYKLEPEVVVKYRLRNILDIDEQTLNALLYDNDLIVFDRLAAKKMSRLRTTHEIETLLLDKGASKAVIKTLIDRYQSYGFLNDDGYVKAYLDNKKASEGPKLIKAKLKAKGVDDEIIGRHLMALDEGSIVSPLARKMIGQMKGKSYRKTMETVRAHLIRKGFSTDSVDDALNHVSDAYQEDELAILKKTYLKLMALYKEKKDAKTLRPFIINKLLAQGFSYDDIKRLFD